MDVVYFFRVLMKRKWIIVGSALLAAVVAYILTRNQPKLYRSSARIATGFTIADDIRINDAFSVNDAELKFNNAINTWTSPSVTSLVAYELILHDLTSPTPFRRLTPAQMATSTYQNVNKDEARRVYKEKLDTMTVLTSYKPDEKKLLELLDLYKYSFKYLNNYFQIYQVSRTDYITIDCATENPELSAFVVNSLYKQFLRYYRNIRSAKSQESLDTLQSIMDKKKADYETIARTLKGEGMVDVTTENTAKLDQIGEYEKSLTAEKNKQTDDYYALRRINQKLQSLGVDVSSGSTTPPANNEELILARKAVNDAYADYLKTNDKDKLARYNQLKEEYNRKYASSSSSSPGTTGPRSADGRETLLEKKSDIEADIDAGKDKIKALEAKIADAKANVSSTASKGANVSSLIEEAKLAEKDYFDAKQKYTNALDVSSSSVNNFRLIQPGQPAIEPEPSKRAIMVGMAGAVTFMSAILIIIFLTYLDSSLRTPGIFAKTVNLRLISMVNFMNFKHKALQDIVTGRADEGDKEEKKRNNVFRESIRKLRYEIENSGHKVFLFTSTKKGQGKTTLIQAVSFSLSMSKKKILIIDTNFSNNDLTVQLHADPVLEKISNDNNSMALVDKIRFFAKDISVGPNAGEVCVIGSEGGDYTPSEVLPRENLLSSLQSLIPQFDFIFLEGPPLNDFSDSRELVRYVDGVVAIFSAVHIVKQIDQESIQFLHGLNGKFCGSVLNMVDLENVNSK